MMKTQTRFWLAGAGVLSLSTAFLLGGIPAAWAQGNDPTPTAQAEKSAKKGKNEMPGMNMSGMANGKSAPMSGMTGMSGMTAVVPRLKEKRVTTVQGNENWDIRTGFGRNGEMVGMMILMMTEGAGMEHMKMGAMNMTFGAENFTETPDEMVVTNAAVPTSSNKPVDASAGTENATVPAAAAPPATEPVAAPAQTPSSPVVVSLKKNPPTVGDNDLDIFVTDPATGKAVTGLAITSLVEMTSMDMGQEKPSVKEIGDGHYAATVNFSMKGPWRVVLGGNLPGGRAMPLTFRVDNKTPWQQQKGIPSTAAASGGASEKAAAAPVISAKPVAAKAPMAASLPVAQARTASGMRVSATIGGAAKVGDNNLTITLLDAQNQPVTGAKIAASVAMTSMDMGTTNPVVKEVGVGKYATVANFSMSGPWRMVVKISASGKPSETANLDFSVKKK